MNASSKSSNKVTQQKSKSMKGEVPNAPILNMPNVGIQKNIHPLSYLELKELYMLTKI